MKIECGKTYKTKNGHIVDIKLKVNNYNRRPLFTGYFGDEYLCGNWYENGRCMDTNLDPTLINYDLIDYDLVAEVQNTNFEAIDLKDDFEEKFKEIKDDTVKITCKCYSLINGHENTCPYYKG